MYQAFAQALLKRGAVFIVFRVDFPDDPHSKYCILMEDYSDGAEDIVVIFTTHRTKFEFKPTTVKVDNGGIKGINGDTLIQCDNYWLFPPDVFFDQRKSKFLTNLTEEQMKRVDTALAFVEDIDEAILIRMLK